MTPEESMEEELQFGIMEDYLCEAEMRHLLIETDGVEHKERMRAHFEKLKQFIRSYGDERERKAWESAKEIVKGIGERDYNHAYSAVRAMKDSITTKLTELS